ncbi:MAG: hypothetical protein IT578_02060 [Verrucomicrobiae bacterium]|nr:hypothetical protein [Verrucomicrobiae bacterium]
MSEVFRSSRHALPEKVAAFVERHGCLFQQPWWLNAVCVPPWSWEYLWLEKGGEVAAAWPLPFKDRLGLRLNFDAVNKVPSSATGAWSGFSNSKKIPARVVSPSVPSRPPPLSRPGLRSFREGGSLLASGDFSISRFLTPFPNFSSLSTLSSSLSAP